MQVLKLKSLFVAIVLLLFSSSAWAGSDEWSHLLTELGEDVSDVTIKGNQQALYWDFDSDVTSAWLFIRGGFRVDICLNAHATSTGSNGVAVDILHLLHTTDTTPNINDATVLVGVSLDGVPSTTGLTNDCIFDVDGPRLIAVDVTDAPDASFSYVSVIAHTKRAGR